MDDAWQPFLPLLVHIQANLDRDLSLAMLSRRAGMSPSHFHRRFKATIGETPRDYVARLRIERGAFRLLIDDGRLMDLALDCGFQNHETFIRAFRRGFGKTPGEYREWIQSQRLKRGARAREESARIESGFELSATKVRRLQSMHLAFIRHIGPYEEVPHSLFDELERWAAERPVLGPRVWLGIGHDAPIATPPDQLRFDAALIVPGPFSQEGRIGYQMLEGAEFAVTTYAGSLDTLPAAYAAIFPRVMSLPGYRLIGLPAVEIYHSTIVNSQLRLFQTEICLPVERRFSGDGLRRGARPQA